MTNTPTDSVTGCWAARKFASAVSIKQKLREKHTEEVLSCPASAPKPTVSRHGAPGKVKRVLTESFIAFNWDRIGLGLNYWCSVWGIKSLERLQNNCFQVCLERLNGAHNIFIKQHFRNSCYRSKVGLCIKPSVFSNDLTQSWVWYERSKPPDNKFLLSFPYVWGETRELLGFNTESLDVRVSPLSEIFLSLIFLVTWSLHWS